MTFLLSQDVGDHPVVTDDPPGPLDTASTALGATAAGEVGLWEAGPGEDGDTETDEVFWVLSGSGVVTFEGGDDVAVAPGALVRLHAGEQTRWSVAERLRKVYVTGSGAEGSGRLLAADLTAMPLGETSHPGIWVEGGWPEATSAQVATIGGARVSVWEVTAGVVADVEHDEYLLVTSGSGVLDVEGGPTLDLRPRTLVRLTAGSRTEWTVLTPIRALLVDATPGSR